MITYEGLNFGHENNLYKISVKSYGKNSSLWVTDALDHRMRVARSFALCDNPKTVY